MRQAARNLTDAIDGFPRGKCMLIHDRDPLFSAGFRATLGSEVTAVKLPVKSPHQSGPTCSRLALPHSTTSPVASTALMPRT